MTLLVVLAVIWVTFGQKKSRHRRFLTIGVLCNLLYGTLVGGDFMQGRFFSFSYLVCVLLIALSWIKVKEMAGRYVYLALGIFLVFYPHTPFNSGLNYNNEKIIDGIADERGFYFNELSLVQYLLKDKNDPFPMSRMAIEGNQFRESQQDFVIKRNIGVFALSRLDVYAAKLSHG